jgi:hypothetical protein
MAHCGGSPAEALTYAARAIADEPADPQPYEVIAEVRRQWPAEAAECVAAPAGVGQFVAASYLSYLDSDMDEAVRRLGAVTGCRPDIAWAAAPWFSDGRFLARVTAAGLADATLNITDYGSNLQSDLARENLVPWLRAVDLVCGREPVAEHMARMAILLRFCGYTSESLALCDRADAVEKVMLTEVVRAGTWSFLGNRRQQAVALRRALALDPANWSLYLDLADLAAADRDYSTASNLVRKGLEYEHEDVTLRAAGAAYHLLAAGSIDDLDLLLDLAPEIPHAGYRNGLLTQALTAEGLPADRLTKARQLLVDN